MGEMSEITKWSEILLELDHELELETEKVKKLKERADKIRNSDLPTAMAELGFDEVKLSNGMKITVKSDVYAQKISEPAIDWLEKNGYGGIVKSILSVSFGKGELDRLNVLKVELENRKFEVTSERTVHAQTLKAFLREQLENGKPIPLDLFGAGEFQVAKITMKTPEVMLLEEEPPNE